MKFESSKLVWLNPAGFSYVENEKIIIVTDPNTDFWQRTYYGFQVGNGPALVMPCKEDFTFTVKCEFESKTQYDQCGIILYHSDACWFKGGVEFEDSQVSRLGSVVTNYGYSDWATTDISTELSQMWYRVSRKGSDYLLENSLEGKEFKQMRLFHLHSTEELVNVGIYACSPKESSFRATFSEFNLEKSTWEAYQNGE